MSSKIIRQPNLPNFLIAGAAKCGTTSLYHYLGQHPDVFLSNPKEPNFFSGLAVYSGSGPGDDRVAESSIATFEEYRRLFADVRNHKAIGEGSVSTLFHHKRAILAIHRHLGDPRIIIILRDPVDSIYSTYNFMRRLGRETLPFTEALNREEARKQMGFMWVWQYREARYYARQIRAFQENFSRVKVLLFEDLKTTPASVLHSVCDFLEIDPDCDIDTRYVLNVSGTPKIAWFNTLFVKPKRLHKIGRKIGSTLLGINRWVGLREYLMRANLQKPAPMPPEIKRQLKAEYREDILKLQIAIRRDLHDWLTEAEKV